MFTFTVREVVLRFVIQIQILFLFVARRMKTLTFFGPPRFATRLEKMSRGGPLSVSAQTHSARDAAVSNADEGDKDGDEVGDHR